MARRIYIPVLHIGELQLDPAQAHHARDVLRLTRGAQIELFDATGKTAVGIILQATYDRVTVRVELIQSEGAANSLQWTIASAVPKGERADWMIEKLSELGAAAFIPLAASRSVVLPQGMGKRERWKRIAAESAKQSRRAGIMQIAELTPVDLAIKQLAGAAAWVMTTEVAGTPIGDAAAQVCCNALTIFIGPEGGWTDSELSAFELARVMPVRLTASILRVETAAIAAGSILACHPTSMPANLD